MADEAKPASKSRTIWFNVIGAFLTAIEGFTGALEAVMSREVYLALLAIAVGGNAVLRFYTTQPLTK